MSTPPTDTKGIEISPTRIRKFRSECSRRWAFGALFDWPEPETPALRFGTALHKVAERWYREGALPDQSTKEGALFASAMHLLPSPGPGVYSELPVKFPAVDGFETPGTADLVWHTAGTVVLYDYKSSTAKKWVKTEAQLLADEQVNCYGLAVMLKFNVTWIRCVWVYMMKDGTQPIVVEFTLTKKKALAYWLERCAPAVKEMLDAYRNTPGSARDFAPNYSNCRAYGKPCTYLEHCENWKREEQQMSKDDLFAKLAAKRAATEAAPAVEDAPAPMINAPEGPQEPQPEPEKPKKKKKPKKPKAPAACEVAAPGMIVLMDCIETKGPWGPGVQLSELARQAMDDAAAAEGVPDWRLIDFKAAGVLAYHFEQYLIEHPFRGVVLVDRFSAEGKALGSTLEQMATLVIRGLK